ncbi:ArsR/SmtB family transcription factor [Vallitalea maricola]|uniref:Metalloregulator ArsR/SmtB family transcription factor n=1 Tax=Vallitalea maricola TaxID=3074433 RepID=A0ACB5UFB5_9FIRM|nr:metalloregulator ArsR/SmtB family transcription factor [Vallitalea sp. AN17-2]
MKIDTMEVNVLKALAHPVRLEIVKKLFDGERCVCQLCDDNEYSQANMSQHLKLLKDADIVNTRKDGNKVIYNIKHEEVKDIITLVNKLVRTEINKLLDSEV